MRVDDQLMQRIGVLIDEASIRARVDGLAREVAGAGLEHPIAIAVLKGSFIFAADLLRALHAAGMRLEVEFMTLSSYRDQTASSGQVTVVKDIESDVRGRDVLLIEDILESGRTLAYARDLLCARGARRVVTCCLLEKPGKRAVSIDADFVGFTCDDVFVVGYGMDMAHSFRELPFIGVVRDKA